MSSERAAEHQRRVAEKTLRKIVRYWGLKGVKLRVGRNPGQGDIWLVRNKSMVEGQQSIMFWIRSNMVNGLPTTYHKLARDNYITARFQLVDMRVSATE